MNDVLKVLNMQRKSGLLSRDVIENSEWVGSNFSGSEDRKSNSPSEVTVMDWIQKHRDMSRISEADLQVLFNVLKQRCPKTWNQELEIRAKDIFEKIEILRKENVAKYLDPEREIINEAKSDQSTFSAKDLFTVPELWNMQKREAGVELRDLLQHFTISAPFQGRPFVRAWFEALVPCLSRWLLQSDSGNELVVKTLKHFLGAFGQPGIVVCLPDKGTSILKILKDSARSVEAMGRGTVERYYWKRLVESSCGGGEEWQEIANMKDVALELSQLDTLPSDWLLDAGDWVEMFANVVSPEISKHFEQYVKDIVALSNVEDVRAGPPKTLARSLAKSSEYKLEYDGGLGCERWTQFGETFRNQFKRPPTKPEDFVWNIVDFARCSIVVNSARDLLRMKSLVEERFPVVGLKNGYSSNAEAKGSGYRDLKLLVLVEFDNLQLGDISETEQDIVMICEIQLICDEWLDNKKNTSLSYKVLRSTTLRNLLRDFAKYLEPTTKTQNVYQSIARDVIKNGWKNLVKYADFSTVDKDELLLASATNGWDPAGVEILITELKADPNLGCEIFKRPANVACQAAVRGNHEVLKTLIDLKADIKDSSNMHLKAAITANAEDCVRVLLNAGSSLSEWEFAAIPSEVLAMPSYERVLKLVKGEHLPLVSVKKGKNTIVRNTNVVVTAAVEGKFTEYLDTHDVGLPVVSEILLSPVFTNSFELYLQALWFGGNVNMKFKGITPLCSAIFDGSTEVVKLLLRLKANINIKISGVMSPPAANPRPMIETLKTVLEAKGNPGIRLAASDVTHTVFHMILTCATDGEKCMELIHEAQKKHFKLKPR